MEIVERVYSYLTICKICIAVTHCVAFLPKIFFLLFYVKSVFFKNNNVGYLFFSKTQRLSNKKCITWTPR